jgi:hypothetical protein
MSAVRRANHYNPSQWLGSKGHVISENHSNLILAIHAGTIVKPYFFVSRHDAAMVAFLMR